MAHSVLLSIIAIVCCHRRLCEPIQSCVQPRRIVRPI